MQAAVLLSTAWLAVALAAEDLTSPSLRGSRSTPDVLENRTESARQANFTQDAVGALLEQGNHTEADLGLLLLSTGGWSQGGDKVWGSGTGIEDVNSGNVGYYDQGMDTARGLCGDAGCALMVNPPGHRTVQQFHIHYVHYQSYGKDLKRKLESKVCGSSGWKSGGLPCSGKAAFFPGFPAVFSSAMTAGSINSASVIAWPVSCDGRGTIVELAYGCSIEHQIRGDFNPALR